MNCPKCGFSQPDDLYCALCGVHVEKYTRQKKKRRLKRSLFTLVLGGGAIVLVGFLWGFPKWSSEEIPNQQQDTVVAPLSQPISNRQPTTRRSSAAKRNQRKKGPSDIATSSSTRSPRKNIEQGAPEDEPKTKLSPGVWLQKGLDIDDESEAEVACYENALKLDPTFSPAYFRLGSIYYRRAHYEKADEEFGKFLKHATDEDRVLYDIYVYYSTPDVDRLLEGLKPEPPASEEEKEGGESEEDLNEDETEENTEETSEGVNTIVHFSLANGHITVPVILNDTVTAKMLVDTGAGITVISNELAEELDLSWEGSRSITLKTMAMDVQAQVVHLESIQVGELKKSRFPVAVASLPIGQNGQFSAILGMDFLNNYTMHIDNKNHTFTLTSKTP